MHVQEWPPIEEPTRSARWIVIALRVPAVERFAWEWSRTIALELEANAADAFRAACTRTLRAGDRCLHEPASNRFVAILRDADALPDVARVASAIASALRRSVDEAIHDITGDGCEGGWTIVESNQTDRVYDATIDEAFARGRRERERYDFFATLGHEMRTPLTAIDGFLTLLLDGQPDPEVRRRYLEIAYNESARLRRLVDTMYTLSLRDLNTEAIPTAQCDAQRAVEAACDAMFPVVTRRNMTIAVHGRVTMTLPLDSASAIQIVENLIENSVKHGFAGGRIEVRIEREGQWIAIAVDDDGPGIAQSDQATIFDALTRGTHAHAPGHGLGLSIVRTIVERVGGDVSVGASALGGATIRLRLPQFGHAPITIR